MQAEVKGLEEQLEVGASCSRLGFLVGTRSASLLLPCDMRQHLQMVLGWQRLPLNTR